MIVEAAMGEPGGMHQFGDADPLEPPLTEELRCCGDDPGLVFLGLGFADLHGGVPDSPLDKMMMFILI
jgi:hypothetical protein